MHTLTVAESLRHVDAVVDEIRHGVGMGSKEEAVTT
jgi:hypothetical protein